MDLGSLFCVSQEEQRCIRIEGDWPDGAWKSIAVLHTSKSLAFERGQRSARSQTSQLTGKCVAFGRAEQQEGRGARQTRPRDAPSCRRRSARPNRNSAKTAEPNSRRARAWEASARARSAVSPRAPSPAAASAVSGSGSSGSRLLHSHAHWLPPASRPRTL